MVVDEPSRLTRRDIWLILKIILVYVERHNIRVVEKHVELFTRCGPCVFAVKKKVGDVE